MVSTPDSESGDPGSNPGRTFENAIEVGIKCGSMVLSMVLWRSG